MQIQRAAAKLKTQARTRELGEIVEKIRAGQDRLTKKQVKELEAFLALAAQKIKEQIYHFEEMALVAAPSPLSQNQAVPMRLAYLPTLKEVVDQVASELSGELATITPVQTEEVIKSGIASGIMEFKHHRVSGFTGLKTDEIIGLVESLLPGVDTDALLFLQNYRIQLMGNLSEQLCHDIKMRISGGIISGKNTPQLVREIGRVIKDKEAFRRASKTVFKSAQQRLMLICRTEINRAHNHGRLHFYKETGVKKVKWWAALDRRCCPECSGRHGQVYDVGKVEAPSLHPRCRCSLFAVV